MSNETSYWSQLGAYEDMDLSTRITENKWVKSKIKDGGFGGVFTAKSLPVVYIRYALTNIW